MTTEHPEQEVLDSMPAIQQQGGALVAQDNPYMAMAVRAMELGKVDQLDKLLDLQLRWDAEQARKAFVDAMAAFKALPIKIVKAKLVSFTTRDGDTTSYRHATLASVVDAVVAGMGNHGLSHRWDVKQEAGQVSVTCTLTHRGGHSESVTMSAAPDTSGKKNSIQQVASAVTYLQRYTLMAMTGVAAEDMAEDDGHAAEAAPIEYITEEQEIVLRDLIAEYITNEDSFFKWIRSARDCQHVEKLSDIPANRFDAIHNKLNEIRKDKAAQA